jgi:hypothetical protein
LTAPAPAQAAGGFQFTVQAGAARTTLIQATTNPSDPSSWITIATNPPTAGTFIFTDTNSSQFPQRYYRTISP